MTAGTATGIVDEQTALLAAAYLGTTARPLANGTVLITVPSIRLPAGWNMSETAVQFIVPVGYPVARLDCFWADANLRLAGGAQPASSGVQQVPGTNETRLWFSWHVQRWDPVRDTLLTYVRVILDRLGRVN